MDRKAGAVQATLERGHASNVHVTATLSPGCLQTSTRHPAFVSTFIQRSPGRSLVTATLRGSSIGRLDKLHPPSHIHARS